MSLGSEAVEFGRSVSETLRRTWGNATAAASGDLGRLGKHAAVQGWYDLGAASALDFLMVAVRELGRRACPLPVVDAYVTVSLVDETTRAAIESGDLRPVVAVTDDVARQVFDHLEAATDATHVLRVVPGSGSVTLLPVLRTEPTPGLAVPAWSRVHTSPEGATFEVGGAAVKAALDIYQFGTAARAIAAAERAHELAVEHAKTRRQFGRPIGAFGAVQQRVAACQIDVSAAAALIEDAVGQLLEGRSHGWLAAGLAVQFVRDVATHVMFGAQHTLGAIGFFEEHEAACLFRRVHADIAVLDVLGATDVASELVERGQSLPAFHLGPVAEHFRSEVRALIAAHLTEDLHGYDTEALRADMAERGLFALGWPKEDGGRAATVEEQAVLNEEMKYARGPVDRAMSAAMLIGHSIRLHGTPEQKAEFLPLIRAGQMAFCLGYSEPEAGSDLASLRTRAEREPSAGQGQAVGWVINGQKSWTTRAHNASHVWLAVRTDPDAQPRHAGITIFLVPMDTPGISVQRHVALSAEISCTVFYDDVRVPDSMRVGEVNGGWKVITDALSAERVIMGGVAATILRHFDDLLGHLRTSPALLGLPGSHNRRRLSSLAGRLQAARALVLAATRAMTNGASKLASPMAAVLSGELAEDFGQAALELLGPAAALGKSSPGAIEEGVFEQALRGSPMYVIGGGTNDIQRGIIARGLGLARE